MYPFYIRCMHGQVAIATYHAHSYLVEIGIEDDVSPVDVGVVDVIANVSVSDKNLRTSFQLNIGYSCNFLLYSDPCSGRGSSYKLGGT